MKFYNLKDKVAIVTGASRGIGKAIATRLSNCGAKVILIARNLDKLKIVQETIISQGGFAESMIGDVSSLDSFAEIISSANEKWGHIDILVNNAVNSTTARASELPDEVILNHINTKVMGYIRCSREVITSMRKKGGGRIVNIAGMGARNSSATNPGSGITNSGVSAYTKCLSDDVSSEGILVNCIHPGSTRTQRQMQLIDERAQRDGVTSEEIMSRTVANVPIGRMVEPDDIANLVLFLVSNQASAITGQTIAVDGGAGRGIIY